MRSAAGSRFVVCGSDALAFRLVTELVDIHGAEVTVVCATRPADGEPSPADIPGVTVLYAPRFTRSVAEQAGVASADAIALVEQNDGGNVDGALIVRELAPELRVVMRIFDDALARSMRTMLPNADVLSATAVAAPAFVAAAIGGDVPTPVRIVDRLLYVSERRDAQPGTVVCALAADGDAARILESSGGPDDLVLTALVTSDALNDDPSGGGPLTRRKRPDHGFGQGDLAERAGTDRAAGAARTAERDRIRRRARRRAAFAVTSLVGKRLRLIAIVLLVLLAGATGALMLIRDVSWWQAIYLAVLNTIAGVTPDLHATRAEQTLQVILTIVSVALIPAATAAVVEAVVSARLALANGGLAAPVREHIVVAGLGDVGTRVLATLDDAGVPVVGVDLDPNARGVAIARERRVPVIIGDVRTQASLRAAYAEHARGTMALTSNDETNLEIALTARRLAEQQSIVLRLFDADFADRVQRAFGFAISRSVSSLAAPSFAAAMLGREVIATIPVRRRVLLVAEIAVGSGSALDGALAAGVSQVGATSVVALHTGKSTIWTIPPGRVLTSHDRIVAVTTRAGLGTLLARSATPDGIAARPAVAGQRKS